VRVGPALTLALSQTQVCNLLEFRDFNRWLLPLKGEQLPQNTWVLLIPALQLLLCTAVACVSCCITCGFTDAVDVVLNLNPNPNPNPYPNPNPNPNPSPNPNPNPNQVDIVLNSLAFTFIAKAPCTHARMHTIHHASMLHWLGRGLA